MKKIYIDLNKISNQNGGVVDDDYIEITDNSIKRWRLKCYNASSLGLGTCNCVSHNTWETEYLWINEYFSLLQLHKKNGKKYFSPSHQFIIDWNASIDDELNGFLLHREFSLQDFIEFLKRNFEVSNNPLPIVRERIGKRFQFWDDKIVPEWEIIWGEPKNSSEHKTEKVLWIFFHFNSLYLIFKVKDKIEKIIT